MDKVWLERIENELEGLCREATRQILKFYKIESLIVEKKEDHSPVTEADRAAHHAIVDGLKSISKLPVLSEEGDPIPYSQRANWTQHWLVDPLDGTKGFIKRTGDFTINIALIQNHEPVLSMVMHPVSGDIYFAAQGKGAKKNGQSIKCGQSAGPLKAVSSKFHAQSSDHFWYEKNNISRVDFINSSIKLCLIASGEYDLYRRFGPTMEWDIAAAQLVLTEAGGVVLREPDFKALKYNKEDLTNPPFIALANSQLLSQLEI